MEKISLRGVELFPFTSYDDAIDYVDSHKGILVAVNAEKVLGASTLKDVINSNVGYCDGAGVQMALRRNHGQPDASKIAGCELWLKIIERFAGKKSFYLVGGKQEIIDETVAKLRREFPGINIVNYRNGYINSPQERAELIADVEARRPDVVFVAMGSPKQELLMKDMQARHNAIYQGLGGSFDVYTGHVLRAPRWWIDHNLEFAYRLIKEPKRIRRQVHLLKFAWWLLTKQV